MLAPRPLIFLSAASLLIILTTILNLPSTPYNKKIKVGNVQVFVELADTAQKRFAGLSGRNRLAKSKGMLFILSGENIRPSFVMRDMNFAIDIVWIDDGRVVEIDENVLPPVEGTPEYKLKIYTPSQGVDYVLEVAAGFSEKQGITVGDPVDLSRILDN